jgi:hypothetical protein
MRLGRPYCKKRGRVNIDDFSRQYNVENRKGARWLLASSQSSAVALRKTFERHTTNKETVKQNVSLQGV